jgi:hypothetical protein
MSNPTHHQPAKERTLFTKVVYACIVPACWMILGAACYLYNLDLPPKVGLAFIFIGLVSLVYNLLRVRKRHLDKKKSLHL